MLVQKVYACDSLVTFQADEINQWIRLYSASDSLATSYQKHIAISKVEIEQLKAQGGVKDQLTADQKRKKRRWVAIAMAGWGLFIASALVGN